MAISSPDELIPPAAKCLTPLHDYGLDYMEANFPNILDFLEWNGSLNQYPVVLDRTPDRAHLEAVHYLPSSWVVDRDYETVQTEAVFPTPGCNTSPLLLCVAHNDPQRHFHRGLYQVDLSFDIVRQLRPFELMDGNFDDVLPAVLYLDLDQSEHLLGFRMVTFGRRFAQYNVVPFIYECVYHDIPIDVNDFFAGDRPSRPPSRQPPLCDLFL